MGTNSNGEVEPTGDVEWAEQFMGHLFHSLRVQVLPPYTPNEEEKADAQKYADNVHALMSEEYHRLRAEVETQGEESSWTAVARKTLYPQSFVDMTKKLWT